MPRLSEWPRWNLQQKGFLVVCVPIAFQIALIAGLLYVQSRYQRDEVLQREGKEVITYTYRLVAIGTEIQSRVRGYAATQNPALAAPADPLIAEFPIDLQNLDAIILRTPSIADDRLVADLDGTSRDFLAYYAGALNDMRAGKRQSVLAEMSKGIGQRLMDRFAAAVDHLLATEGVLDAKRSAATARARTRIDVALVGGGALSIAVAALLTVLFTQNIAGRVRIVSTNMDRLERNEPLAETVGGSDEIAALDRRFHDMAAALKESDEQWKRAEDNLRRFFTISFEMLCIAGYDGYFKMLNPAWQKELGYPLSYLYSKPFMEFVHPDDRERTTAEAQGLAGGRASVSFENRYQHADGSYRWLLWNARAFPEGKIIYAAAADITDRKNFESTLRDRNDELEKVNQELESFSYSVSHDLRSPLRAVDGYARILEEDYAPKLDDEARRVLLVIRSEARRMGQLIDDLLSFSRAGRQSLSTAAVDLGSIAEQIVGEKRRKYPDKQIEFVRGEAPVALADAGAIRHVMFNLIANAVKYSKPGGQVHIEFGGETHNGENHFWLRDRGIGFDPKYSEKIFGVFQRLNTSVEGSGVGLAIVQRIVEKHGGRVWAEGEPDKGAAFFFTLPNRRENEGEEEVVS
ncbi:MAG TPA: ATP-binding protein [Thermoanaerobaculia bacterium]|nr:ATP-binding protein [Thermoanaerobaculia bacterium]